MTGDDLQLEFDFIESEAKIEDIKEGYSSEKEKVNNKIPFNCEDIDDNSTDSRISVKDMKRAVLGWLSLNNPTGAGALVPTRLSKYYADVAAFWSKSISISGKKYLAPVKTVIIEIRHNREHCWPDCSNKDELLGFLKEEKSNKQELEKYIRTTEPNLRIDDNLFAEFESWNYRKSSNKDYHTCLHKIDEIEKALYNGSKFEKIRRAEVADYLYLAVPEGEVEEQELADGWGLLYIDKNFDVRIVKEPFNWNCPLEKKYHLVQNISASSYKDTLFANGIHFKEDELIFTKLPRRRRK